MFCAVFGGVGLEGLYGGVIWELGLFMRWETGCLFGGVVCVRCVVALVDVSKRVFFVQFHSVQVAIHKAIFRHSLNFTLD
jgi:hypothetical protein